jgi:DNA-binding protein HU-beta
MNKDELAKVVGKECHVSQNEGRYVIDVIFDAISTHLIKGRKVNIVNFGKFQTVKRAARRGRNPYSGTNIDIPEKLAPTWKASRNLRRAVNSVK